jgi:hypothetical protein
MPYTIRPSRRFPVQCAVTYNVGPSQGHSTIWNLSCAGWQLFGDLLMRPGETLSLTLPNEQHIPIQFAVENVVVEPNRPPKREGKQSCTARNPKAL